MKILAVIYTLLALSFAAQSNAQTEKKLKSMSPERWFRVELVIFSRTNDSTDEKWPYDLKLQYSPNLVQLIDGNYRRSSEHQSTETLVYGSSIPFKTLDDSQLNLRAHARSLARKKGYQLLFHEAWDHPVLGEKEAPAIMISAGKEFGNHKTLEGEIKLSVARYLHFSTNLWLSEYEKNDGELALNGQPRLPDYPWVTSGINISDATSDVGTTLGARGNKSDAFSPFKLQPSLDTTNDSDNSYQFEPYLPSQIIQHKQHRRMRSNELHYLDNPRLGVLIKILPL
jgi:hypothetical protein